MVNDLQDLMRDNVADPPPDRFDTGSLVAAGRQRVRRRRRVLGGAVGTVVLVAAAGVAVSWTAGGGDPHLTAHPPTPDAPVMRLSDATAATAGDDYRVLASHTNENLDRANGQYFDGVTSDGLILFQDGPRGPQWQARFALMDPSTGEKDWLDGLDIGQSQVWPVELSDTQVVLIGLDGNGASGESGHLVAYVYDRAARAWTTHQWATLPKIDRPEAVMGPDGRLYVSVSATRAGPPPGGWPTGSGGEADDADAPGDTNRLYSVSLNDASDVRDENLTIGSLAFTQDSMVWTNSTNGAAGDVHVRDLTTGQEHSFDPHAGERCNLLSFGATDDRVVMGEYCGTYAHGERDDRVQILTTSGEQVVTIQGSGIDGALAGTGAVNGPGGDAAATLPAAVVVDSYERNRVGTYVYDLDTGAFQQLADSRSQYGAGSAILPSGQFFWSTPLNHQHGATQWLGQLQP